MEVWELAILTGFCRSFPTCGSVEVYQESNIVLSCVVGKTLALPCLVDVKISARY
jgi:hypothetical protein